MPNQAWVGLLNQGPAWSGAGTLLNTAATATISPQPSSNYDFPIQNGGLPYGWYAGLILRVTASGFITTVSTSGTLTFLLAANTTNGTGTTYTTLATSAGITTGTTVTTGIQWELYARIRCTAIASSGNTLSTQGVMRFTNNATAPTLNAVTNAVTLSAGLPAISGETAAAVNTAGASPAIGVALRCTQATSTCSVQLSEWLLEALD
jgi:hypothetical protein